MCILLKSCLLRLGGDSIFSNPVAVFAAIRKGDRRRRRHRRRPRVHRLRQGLRGRRRGRRVRLQPDPRRRHHHRPPRPRLPQLPALRAPRHRPPPLPAAQKERLLRQPLLHPTPRDHRGLQRRAGPQGGADGGRDAGVSGTSGVELASDREPEGLRRGRFEAPGAAPGRDGLQLRARKGCAADGRAGAG